MKNFDRFIAIDWSGAKTPVINRGIGVASCAKGSAAPRLEYCNGNNWSRHMIADWIETLAHEKARTLIGIDCNFSYGEETGQKQFGDDYTAFDVWRTVDEACLGHANYFGGAYILHDEHGRHFWTGGAMPDGFSPSPRLTEGACKRLGLGNPESPFKLIGAKQVGKGGLSGMRLLHDLKKRLGIKMAVWPFDKNTDGAAVVIAEIYPRLFLKMAGHGNRKVPKNNLSSLNDILMRLESAPYTGNGVFSDHDSDAIVSSAGLRMLCGRDKTVPSRYAIPDAPDKALLREGWIFGVAEGGQ